MAMTTQATTSGALTGADVAGGSLAETRPTTAANGWASLVSLLSVRGFAALCLGNGLALSGLRLQSIAIAWLVLDMTGSKMWLGIVNGVPALAVVCFSLLGGVLADSKYAARALLWTHFSLAGATFLAGVLVTTGEVEVAFLALITVVSVAATAVDMPVGRTLIQDMLGTSRLQSGTALSSMAMNLANVAGPIAVGFLIGSFGVDAALYALTGSYLVAALAVPSIRRSPNETGKRPIDDLHAGLAYWRSTPTVAALVSLAFLVPLAGVFFAMVPVYAREVLVVGPAGLGLTLAAFGGGTVVGSGYSVLNGQMSRRGLKLGVLGFIFAAGMSGFGLSRDIFLSTGIAFAMGATAMLWQNTLSATVQALVQPEMKGRVMSIFTMGIQLVGLGWLFGGLLSASAGPTFAVVVAGVAFAGFNLLVFARSEEVRSMN